VEEFLAITGDNCTPDQAIRYLTMSNESMEIALNIYFRENEEQYKMKTLTMRMEKIASMGTITINNDTPEEFKLEFSLMLQEIAKDPMYSSLPEETRLKLNLLHKTIAGTDLDLTESDEEGFYDDDSENYVERSPIDTTNFIQERKTEPLEESKSLFFSPLSRGQSTESQHQLTQKGDPEIFRKIVLPDLLHKYLLEIKLQRTSTKDFQMRVSLEDFASQFSRWIQDSNFNICNNEKEDFAEEIAHLLKKIYTAQTVLGAPDGNLFYSFSLVKILPMN